MVQINANWFQKVSKEFGIIQNLIITNKLIVKNSQQLIR